MKSLALFILVSCIVCVADNGYSQDRTTGTRTEVDSASGKTITTTYVEVTKTEDITPRHDMLVINPLKFFLFYNLSYFHSFNQLFAAGIGVQTPTPSSLSGFGVNAEVRFYPSKHSLRGFYVAPNFSFNSIKESSSYDTYSFNYSEKIYSIGVLLGWQWFPGDDFAMGLGIGVDHYMSSGTTSGGSLYDGFKDIAPALRFDIGYGW